MAKKMLGRVVAGAALGGTSLLLFNPAVTYAAGHEDEGKVLAKQDSVRPGDHVKLLETCPAAQQDAYVWSKVTGTVHLNPVQEKRGDRADRDGAGQQEDADQKGHDGKDRNGGDEQGGHEQGRDEQGRDEQGRDEQGRDEQGREERGEAPDDFYGTPKPPAPEPPADADVADPAYGGGGGMSDGSDADQGPDGTMREEDQGKADESGGQDRKDHHWTGHDEYSQGPESEDPDGTGHDENGGEHRKDFVYYGEATVAAGAQPGTYRLKGSCGEGELVVLPKGPVNGGDGGLTRTSTNLGMAAGGAGMVGAAALGGLVLMRRRRINGLR